MWLCACIILRISGDLPHNWANHTLSNELHIMHLFHECCMSWIYLVVTTTKQYVSSKINIVWCCSVASITLTDIITFWKQRDCQDCQDWYKCTFLANVRYMLSPVRLSSVTFVRPTQAVQIFGNISTALGTLAIHWHPLKISQRSSQGNPSAGGVKHKRGSHI